MIPNPSQVAELRAMSWVCRVDRVPGPNYHPDSDAQVPLDRRWALCGYHTTQWNGWRVGYENTAGAHVRSDRAVHDINPTIGSGRDARCMMHDALCRDREIRISL